MGRDFNRTDVKCFDVLPRLQLSRLVNRVRWVLKTLCQKNGLEWYLRFIGAGASILGLLEMDRCRHSRKTHVHLILQNLKSVIRDTTWTGYAYAKIGKWLQEGKSQEYNRKDRMDFSHSPTVEGFSCYRLILDLLKGENYEGEPLFTDTGALTNERRKINPSIQRCWKLWELGNALWYCPNF